MATDQEMARFHYSLDQEMERGAALLKRGIEGQRMTHIGETARFLFMVDLAGGVERMLKVAWALAFKQATGAYPTAQQFQSEMRHGLIKLADGVAGLYPDEFLRIPDARWGKEYLAQDRFFREALTILDHFARQGRYYHVDALGGRVSSEDAPERQWTDLEWRVAEDLFPDENDRFRRVKSFNDADFHAPVNARMVQIFELFGYVMFRLIAGGLPDTDGRQWSSLWKPFLRVKPGVAGFQAYVPNR